MQTLSVVITTPPSSYLTITAIDYIHSAINEGVSIVGVFFYQSGVLNASANISIPHDEYQTHTAWEKLKKEHSIKLHVCITACEKRGLSDELDSKNTPSSFRLRRVSRTNLSIATNSTILIMNNIKKIAILNASPTINEASKEALDAALIYGSFEQPTSLFFQGEGVRQLVTHQQLDVVHVKDYLKTMAALEFYDIDNIYLCKKSLTDRGLAEDFHIDNVQVLSAGAFSEQLHQHDVILRF